MGKIQALKTGISLLWKAPKGKINSKMLGYVCPNGNINFASENAAFGYAKNCVIKTLKSEKPYERGFVIKDSAIIADIHGTENNVNFSGIDLTNATIIHGHPYNTPISLGDALILIKHKMKKIVAFNNSGEYSSLTNIPFKKQKWHKLIPNSLLENFKNTYWINNLVQLKKVTDKVCDMTVSEMLRREPDMKTLKKEFQNLYENANEPLRKMINKWLKLKNKNLIVDTSEFPAEIRPVFDKMNEFELKSIPIESKYAHRLWFKHAKDFNLVYETNYSNDLIKSWNS